MRVSAKGSGVALMKLASLAFFFCLSQAFSVSFEKESQHVIILATDKWVWWHIQVVPSLAKHLNFFLGAAWWQSCKGLVNEKNPLSWIVPLIVFHLESPIWFEQKISFLLVLLSLDFMVVFVLKGLSFSRDSSVTFIFPDM